jgi:hypothetical protein
MANEALPQMGVTDAKFDGVDGDARKPDNRAFWPAAWSSIIPHSTQITMSTYFVNHEIYKLREDRKKRTVAWKLFKCC